MSKYVIVGAGAIGSGVATKLAAQGHAVTVVTRSGSGPQREQVQLVAADATDATRLSELCEGADALFNCANPLYHRWMTDWPPLATAMLTAAERSGATLTIMGNLYAYGPPSAPMTPHDPLVANYAKAQVRATMWREALAAHEAGRVHAVEVRASDFIGPNSQSIVGERTIPRLLKGKSVHVIGSADVVHSWTYVDDVATTLVACAQDEASWGRAWHVPTNEARTSRQLFNELADVAGVSHVKVSPYPMAVLRLVGLFSPQVREFPKTLYQFQMPFVIDDRETREHFHFAPTPWAEVLAQSLSPFLVTN